MARRQDTCVFHRSRRRGVTEIGTRCDLCGRHGAARYLDYDRWACEECARDYLIRLRLRG